MIDFEISVMCKKAKDFGHVMRRENTDTVKRSLCGRFVPDFDGEPNGKEFKWLFDVRDLNTRRKRGATILENVCDYLVYFCGIPSLRSRLL